MERATGKAGATARGEAKAKARGKAEAREARRKRAGRRSPQLYLERCYSNGAGILDLAVIREARMRRGGIKEGITHEG
jgi:hypothetical protein